VEGLRENAIEMDARQTREAVRAAEVEAYRERLVRTMASPSLVAAYRAVSASPTDAYASWLPVYEAELARRREAASKEFAAIIVEAQRLSRTTEDLLREGLQEVAEAAGKVGRTLAPSSIEPWAQHEYTVTYAAEGTLTHVAKPPTLNTMCGKRRVRDGKPYCDSLVDCLDCLDRYVAERNARHANPR
jgi:hypothetical protein